VLFGATALTVATPAVFSTCYFAATNSGVTVTAAGVTAGVKVLVYLFHNGTIPSSCQKFGSKGHWAVACGVTNPNCGSTGNCIPPV
jgi:hypothetical protein